MASTIENGSRFAPSCFRTQEDHPAKTKYENEFPPISPDEFAAHRDVIAIRCLTVPPL
jgi:hypothetical protein